MRARASAASWCTSRHEVEKMSQPIDHITFLRDSKRRSPISSASRSPTFRRSASRPNLPFARGTRDRAHDILHGGAIMALADNLGGAATVANLPKGARTATIESKTNFFAAIPARRDGACRVHAAAPRPHHHGVADEDHARRRQTLRAGDPDADRHSGGGEESARQTH